ncbi:Uncharacterised protein [Yersinia frederiksenii]|nr:Uncharacterised protein [Yersinia frederiksenii]
MITCHQTHQCRCRHPAIIGGRGQAGLGATGKGRPAGDDKSDTHIRHRIASGIFHRDTQCIGGTAIGDCPAGDAKVGRCNHCGSFIGDKGRVLRYCDIASHCRRYRMITCHQTHQCRCRHPAIIGGRGQAGLGATGKGRPAGDDKSDTHIWHRIAITILHCGTQPIGACVVSHCPAGDTKVGRRNHRGGLIRYKGRIFRYCRARPHCGRYRVIPRHQTHQLGGGYTAVIGGRGQAGLGATGKGRPAGDDKSDTHIWHHIAPGILHRGT